MKRVGKFFFENMLYIIVFILGILYIMYGFAAEDNIGQAKQRITKVGFEGLVNVDEGGELRYLRTDQIKDVRCERMVLRGHFTKNIPKNEVVYIKTENLRCTIYVNEDLIFDNDFYDVDMWSRLESPGIKTNDDVEIYLYVEGGDKANAMYEAMNSICYGEQALLLKEQITKYKAYIIVSLIILIFGISVMVVAAILWCLNFEHVREYFVCGTLAASGAMCCIFNYDYIQLLIPAMNGVLAMDYFFQTLLSVSLLVYLRCYMRDKRSRSLSRAFCHFWVLSIIVNFSLASKAGRHMPYSYGPMMTMLIVFVLIELLLIAYEYSRTENRDIQGVFVGSAFMAIATIVEVIHYLMVEYWWYWPIQMGLAVFTTMQLMILINISRRGLRQAMRVKEMEKEVMQANIYSMVSQIQPHFLYNSLGTIRALISIDPERASEVVDHFSKYLRANMESLTQQSTIPFRQELEHVDNYLYIEEVRFGERLYVEYDLQVEDFNCPSLILQTTVENAVKHGICNQKDGGTIWIRSYQDEDYYYIQVEDDGVGFDTEAEIKDERKHVGIENSKNRLKDMCGGSYIIESTVGIGTKVTMKIPKHTPDYVPYEPLI